MYMTCISLMTNIVEYFTICLLGICMSSFDKCLFSLCLLLFGFFRPTEVSFISDTLNAWSDLFCPNTYSLLFILLVVVFPVNHFYHDAIPFVYLIPFYIFTCTCILQSYLKTLNRNVETSCACVFLQYN